MLPIEMVGVASGLPAPLNRTGRIVLVRGVLKLISFSERKVKAPGMTRVSGAGKVMMVVRRFKSAIGLLRSGYMTASGSADAAFRASRSALSLVLAVKSTRLIVGSVAGTTRRPAFCLGGVAR